MQVGDLVQGADYQFKGRVGIILSIIRTDEVPPDYRRPDQYSVYWGFDIPIDWLWRNELQLVSK